MLLTSALGGSTETHVPDKTNPILPYVDSVRIDSYLKTMTIYYLSQLIVGFEGLLFNFNDNDIYYTEDEVRKMMSVLKHNLLQSIELLNILKDFFETNSPSLTKIMNILKKVLDPQGPRDEVRQDVESLSSSFMQLGNHLKRVVENPPTLYLAEQPLYRAIEQVPMTSFILHIFQQLSYLMTVDETLGSILVETTVILEEILRKLEFCFASFSDMDRLFKIIAEMENNWKKRKSSKRTLEDFATQLNELNKNFKRRFNDNTTAMHMGNQEALIQAMGEKKSQNIELRTSRAERALQYRGIEEDKEHLNNLMEKFKRKSHRMIDEYPLTTHYHRKNCRMPYEYQYFLASSYLKYKYQQNEQRVKQLVVAPTGMGKTIIMMTMARQIFDRLIHKGEGERRAVLILMKGNQIKQFKDEFLSSMAWNDFEENAYFYTRDNNAPKVLHIFASRAETGSNITHRDRMSSLTRSVFRGLGEYKSGVIMATYEKVLDKIDDLSELLQLVDVILMDEWHYIFQSDLPDKRRLADALLAADKDIVGFTATIAENKDQLVNALNFCRLNQEVTIPLGIEQTVETIQASLNIEFMDVANQTVPSKEIIFMQMYIRIDYSTSLNISNTYYGYLNKSKTAFVENTDIKEVVSFIAEYISGGNRTICGNQTPKYFIPNIEVLDYVMRPASGNYNFALACITMSMLKKMPLPHVVQMPLLGTHKFPPNFTQNYNIRMSSSVVVFPVEEAGEVPNFVIPTNSVYKVWELVQNRLETAGTSNEFSTISEVKVPHKSLMTNAKNSEEWDEILNYCLLQQRYQVENIAFFDDVFETPIIFEPNAEMLPVMAVIKYAFLKYNAENNNFTCYFLKEREASLALSTVEKSRFNLELGEMNTPSIKTIKVRNIDFIVDKSFSGGTKYKVKYGDNFITGDVEQNAAVDAIIQQVLNLSSGIRDLVKDKTNNDLKTIFDDEHVLKVDVPCYTNRKLRALDSDAFNLLDPQSTLLIHPEVAPLLDVVSEQTPVANFKLLFNVENENGSVELVKSNFLYEQENEKDITPPDNYFIRLETILEKAELYFAPNLPKEDIVKVFLENVGDNEREIVQRRFKTIVTSSWISNSGQNGSVSINDREVNILEKYKEQTFEERFDKYTQALRQFYVQDQLPTLNVNDMLYKDDYVKVIKEVINKEHHKQKALIMCKDRELKNYLYARLKNFHPAYTVKHSKGNEITIKKDLEIFNNNGEGTTEINENLETMRERGECPLMYITDFDLHGTGIDFKGVRVFFRLGIYDTMQAIQADGRVARINSHVAYNKDGKDSSEFATVAKYVILPYKNATTMNEDTCLLNYADVLSLKMYHFEIMNYILFKNTNMFEMISKFADSYAVQDIKLNQLRQAANESFISSNTNDERKESQENLIKLKNDLLDKPTPLFTRMMNYEAR